MLARNVSKSLGDIVRATRISHAYYWTYQGGKSGNGVSGPYEATIPSPWVAETSITGGPNLMWYFTLHGDPNPMFKFEPYDASLYDSIANVTGNLTVNSSGEFYTCPISFTRYTPEAGKPAWRATTVDILYNSEQWVLNDPGEQLQITVTYNDGSTNTFQAYT